MAIKIYKANHYAKLKKYDSAYYLAEQIRKLGYQFNFQKHNTEISKFKEKYDNQKLRADNLEIEAKRKKNRNWKL